MLNILIAILMFAVLIAIHEFGHYAAAKLSGVQVNEFSIGMGPAIFKKQYGETLYSLRCLPIGGYCAMEGEDAESDNPRAFGRAKTWKKIVILVAGAFMNFVLGFLIILALFATATGFVMPTIGGFLEGYDNENCGLMANDVVKEVNGHPIYTFGNLGNFLYRAGDVVDFVVERDGVLIQLTDVYLPLQEKTDAEGNTTILRGITIGQERYEPTFSNIMKFTWYNTLDFVRLIYMNLLDLITGALKVTDMSGAVGIVDSIAQVGEASEDLEAATLNISYFMALITINLAVMNLLPLPALDGGRIFFILGDSVYYAITKKNIAVKYEAIFHGIGLVLLLVLMLVVTVSDVGRIMNR
ncbi:MAG: M50 family metallopeptidase [Eubacteriales bacterium]